MKKQEVKEKVSKKEVRKNEVIKSNKKDSLISGIFTTLLVIIVAAFFIKPLFSNLKYGLDLEGGFEILYQVKNTDGSKVNSDTVKNTYSIIEKRINVLGVSEPEISIEGNNIRVQLAGITDEADAKETISKMANLTFRNSKDELVMDSSVLKASSVAVVESQNKNELGKYSLEISIKDIDKFHEQTEIIRKNDDVLVMWLDFEEGEDTFETAKFTCGTSGSSRCISYAKINDELTTDKVILSGNFTKEEATKLAELINSGSLPTKLVEISSQSVNPTLGNNSLEKTYLAGVIGIILIMLLLIVLYRFGGFITSVSILAYTMLVFTIFELIDGRLTLPGIAAVVIGIGMAVDAAVISFSSIKRELADGKKLNEAFINGNKSSIKAIIDSNITTLIAAVVLYYFGVSSVRGFATMLIISIFVTIIVMVYFNRLLLSWFVSSGMFDKHPKIFVGGYKNKQFKADFMKRKLITFMIPVILIVVGVCSFFVRGINLSIDFKGGTNITLNTTEKLTVKEIKTDLDSLGYKYENVELLDKNTANIKLKKTFVAADNKKVTDYYKGKYNNPSINIGAISNVVKKDLVKNAIKALVIACLCILVYISIRFRFTNAIGTILALIHDCLIVFFAFCLCKFEISPVFIAAILSIIGYSINDTIVIFDRIRETINSRGLKGITSKKDLDDVVNEGLSSVLSRCIITSCTTLIPVITLLIFGSHDIFTFNIALLIGLVAGTYSSLFIAVQIWALIEAKSIGKPKRKKWYEDDDDEKEVEELKVKGINC